MQGTTMRHGKDDHKGRSYKIEGMKMACIITRMKRQVRISPIAVVDYLRKEMMKANEP